LSLSVAILAGVAPLSHVTSAFASVFLKAETRSPIPPPAYKKACESEATSESAMVRCVDSQVAQLNGEIRFALAVEAAYLGRSGVASTESRWLEFMKSECTLEEHPYSGGSIQPLIYGVCERDLLFNRIAEVRSVVGSTPR